MPKKPRPVLSPAIEKVIGADLEPFQKALAESVMRSFGVTRKELGIPPLEGPFKYGRILRYPPTGEMAMVIGGPELGTYVSTICLGGSSVGYKVGDIMGIAVTMLGNWEIVE